MTRILSTIAALALTLGLFAACSGGGGGPTTDSLELDQTFIDIPIDTGWTEKDIEADGGDDGDVTQEDKADPGDDADGGREETDGGGGELCTEAAGFGCDCITNEDCKSGYCINTTGGKKCSKLCYDECPAGFSCEDISSSGTDPVYICMASYLNVCKPCLINGDCYDFADNGDRCVTYGAIGSFCGKACVDDASCPELYGCMEVTTAADKSAMQCVPLAGECSCNEYFVTGGFLTECIHSNDFGVCTGERSCTDDGLSPCGAAIPAEEVCDLEDNDCDGQVDEGMSEPEQSGCKHIGVCATDVKAACVNGEWICSYDEVSDYEPIEKTCDAKDNDCDGQTDEGLTDVAQSSCLSVGVCSGGVKAICNAGLWTCDYGDVAGYEPDEQSCDGQDNDCDGQIDEEVGGAACTNENTFGVCAGVMLCSAGGVGSCDGPIPAAEICDEVDNDCDGQTDEGFPDSDTDGLADCVDPDDDNDGILDDGDASGQVGDTPCQAGLFQGCDDNCRLTFNVNQADLDGDGKGDLCDEDLDGDTDPNGSDCAPEDATISSKAVEQCADQIDNDCDGQTDEEGGADCIIFYRDNDDDGLGVLIDTKCLCSPADPYDASQVGDCDDAEPSIYLGAPETCDGVDQDCDGQTDEGYTDTDLDGQADCVDPDDDNDTVLDDGDGDGLFNNPCQPGQLSYCDDNCRLNSNTDQADQDDDDIGDMCDDDIDGDGTPNVDDCKPLDPAIHPGAAEPCDDVDNDCDAQTDEGQDGAGCDTYYKDIDGDNWGNATDSRCLCAPDAQSSYDAETSGDCCDTDENAKPSQQSYFGSANQCGSFDYNCDNASTLEFTETGECGGFTCGFKAGWAGSVPACGVNADWMSGCSGTVWICTDKKEKKTQKCR